MNNKRATKRALLTSVTALVMCVVMLAGTTFAWFTDTASTGVNKIQAGNLDIEVKYTLDGENWNNLDGATDIFQKGLWEPGHTEVVALKVTNTGSLALKYNISMNVVSETEGTNKAGEPYKLSDYLKVKTLAQGANDFGNIALGMAFDTRAKDGLAYDSEKSFSDVGVLANDQSLQPGMEGNYIIMKVYMPETVGNEANARSTKEAASIEFGINVVATQQQSERDSFGDNYDRDATYPVIVSNQQQANDAITNAANKKATIVMPANTKFTLDSGIAHEGDKSRDITFVGDGTQTVDVVKNAITAEGGELNYQRGSTFTFENMTIQAGEGSFDGIVCDELTYKNCTIKGKLTLYGKATFIDCVFENDMANQYSIWTWGGTDVTFEGCKFNTNGKAILLYGRATEAKPTNLVVNNCIFNDGKNGAAGKAAIEIGNDYSATYTLTVNNATVNGFAAGKNTGSKLWANKNSMDAAHLTVTIDGSKIQ